MKSRIALALITLLSCNAHSALAQHKPDKEERAAMTMTPEQVSRSVEKKGAVDPLEPSIWISTRPFLLGNSGSDKFLRANIDKATGEVVYQLYLSGVFPYSMRFDRMTYLVSGKLRQAKVDRVYFDVSCQRYGCSHYEDYVVQLERNDLDALSTCVTGSPYWKARLFGQSVEGTDVDVLCNETAGFLVAVDRAVAKLKPTPADQ
jgi:hypothetical protein